MKVIKSTGNGRFVACFEKKAQPDFKGVLKDGTMIVFEAKHTDSDQIKQTAVTEYQAEQFEIYQRMKARCFVLVSFELNHFYNVPWEVFKSMKKLFGRKYATEKDLEEYRIMPEYGIIPFLGKKNELD